MVATNLPGPRNSGMGTPVMRLRYVSVLVASGTAIVALTGCGSSSSGSPRAISAAASSSAASSAAAAYPSSSAVSTSTAYEQGENEVFQSADSGNPVNVSYNASP